MNMSQFIQANIVVPIELINETKWSDSFLYNKMLKDILNFATANQQT